MSRLLILWHSRTGAAQALAQAAADGAGDIADLRQAEAAGPDDLIAADGYLFVCPENLGTMTGAMKEMFDRCYYPVLGRVEGRPYATIIAAGSAGQGAEAQIDRIAAGWRLRRIAEGLIAVTGAQTPEAIIARKIVQNSTIGLAKSLGAGFGEGLRLGIY